MNIRQLNEVLNLYTDGRFKYADIDAQAVYDNCVNADFGSHTFEEADKFKEFVGITKETTEEELRAIRNTLVKFWADAVKEFKGDDHGKSRSKEESDREWKMGDQMQFYTTVIDMAINNLPEDKRIHEDYDDFEGEEDWDEMLDDFLSSLPTKLEAKLGEGYECHQTDDTIYVNSEERPDNTVFISPIEDSTQMINIGLLDDSNEEIECYEIEIENFDDWSINNIADNIKELFGLINESFAESKNEDYEITNQDRIDVIREDERDLKNAIDGVCNRFEAYSKNWDEEKQQMIQDRIMEIMETAETNLRNMIKRMK